MDLLLAGQPLKLPVNLLVSSSSKTPPCWLKKKKKMQAIYRKYRFALTPCNLLIMLLLNNYQKTAEPDTEPPVCHIGDTEN
jgi:hypothetical protein